MTEASEKNDASDKGEQPGEQSAHRVRLPAFITDDEIGLGDAIQRTTSYFGIPTCGGCQRRAAALNRWLAFTPRRSK
jgi:hypothetical protein